MGASGARGFPRDGPGQAFSMNFTARITSK
jgi:hypothetical protein